MSENFEECLKKANDLFNKGDYVSAVDTVDAIQNKNQKVLDFKYNLLSKISKICYENNDTHSHLYCLIEMDRIKPNNENILLSIAFDLERSSDLPNALLYYEKVLNVNKRNYDALIHIALLFITSEKYQIALKYIEKAKREKPNNYKTSYAYFKLYENQAKFKEALRYAKEMYMLQPDNIDSCYNCARTYYQVFDYNKTIEFCDKTLKLEPDNESIKCLKIEALKKLGLIDNVYEEYKKLLENNPDSYTIKRFYASHALENKDYKIASEYFLDVHSPSKIKQSGKKVEDKFIEYEKKRWRREDITGKTILIHQGTFGAGDFVMFSSYIPLIEEKAKKVIIETTGNFMDLFRYNFKKSEIIQETKFRLPEEKYDFSVSCLDLLYSMNIDFNNILTPEGWLKISDEKIKKMQNTGIFDTQKKKIGIFWRGSGGLTKFRNIDLQKLIPLFELENCCFYSFDIEEKDDIVFDTFKKYNVTDCSPYIKTAEDTGAILKNIDILITIDSFPLHLAGALGVKAFLILPVLADWRWFNDTKTTPWYNSVEIFRQTTTENIDIIIQKIKQELLSNNI